MQTPEFNPFKAESKLRKYEGGETLLERRKRPRLTITPNFWAVGWWPKFTRYEWKSIMTPPLPNMRTLEAMVVCVEQELVYISEFIVALMGQELAHITRGLLAECDKIMHDLINELEEELMHITQNFLLEVFDADIMEAKQEERDTVVKMMEVRALVQESNGRDPVLIQQLWELSEELEEDKDRVFNLVCLKQDLMFHLGYPLA